MHHCVGFLELRTITRGLLVTDGLLKKAAVEILFAYPVSSGKYLSCFSGEVEDVKSSLAAGKKIGGSKLLDFFVLPNIHPKIIPAIKEKITIDQMEALGVLETFTCASCIVAADIALKTSGVRLAKIQLAKGIGGRAYFVLEGEIGEVESAMLAAGRQVKARGGKIVDEVIISQASPQMLYLFDKEK